MVWFIRIFVDIIALSVIIWLVLQVKNLFASKHSSDAVVQKRYFQEFPLTIGSSRHTKKEYHLTFFLPEENKTMDFQVRNALYVCCPKGTEGILTYRGTLMLDFVGRGAAAGES